MVLQYLGHGCVLISTEEYKLLVDPFISPNPLASHIDIESLEAHYILLTHAHNDHIADVEFIATRTQATIISNYEIANYYETKGLEAIGMNHGGKSQFPFGMLKYVIAVHSSVFPDGTYGGNPGGFVLWTVDKCIYMSGDTALTMDMKLIPLTCPKLDLAILTLGDHFTMGYEDAAIAADFVECNRIVGVHYNTFPALKIDKIKAISHFADSGKELLLPAIGESITI